MKVVFDAGPLITACKFKPKGKLVIDHLLAGCEILIPSVVEEEVAVSGAQYPDGVAAGERIATSKLQVVSVSTRQWERHLQDSVDPNFRSWRIVIRHFEPLDDNPAGAIWIY